MQTSPVVHVVDDDEAVRRSLGKLIESVGLEARAYDSAEAFLEQLAEDALGCVVLDVRTPRMSGLTVQQILKDRRHDIPVIFITGHGDVAMAVAAMKSGAADFIEKPFHLQTMLDAIQSAIARHERILAARRELRRLEARVSALNRRELDIVRMILEGRTTKGIAGELGLSTRTVEVHRANMFEKIGVASLSELITTFARFDLGMLAAPEGGAP